MVLVVCAAPGEGLALEIYVSVDGSAQPDGSPANTYESLPDTLQAVRTLRKEGSRESPFPRSSYCLFSSLPAVPSRPTRICWAKRSALHTRLFAIRDSRLSRVAIDWMTNRWNPPVSRPRLREVDWPRFT